MAHLTAALCKVFPKIKCDYLRDAELILRKLPDDELQKYQGVIGHYHVQTHNIDPGPALDWDYLIVNARQLMSGTDISLDHMRKRF